jgi:large subunit ribosomal protein L3
MKFILGKKLEMSQIFDDKGDVIPVTLISVEPCQVTQVKTKEKDGYEAIQLGCEKIEKAKKIKKTMKGKEFRYLKEERTDNKEQLKMGDMINASLFKEGDLVNVSGTSKGKGFAGVVKRWHFKGQYKTHGTKEKWRSPGSIGMRHPQRVVKGKKMGGRMGGGKITVKNLKVAKIDLENNILAVKGAIPGRSGILLEIRASK